MVKTRTGAEPNGPNNKPIPDEPPDDQPTPMIAPESMSFQNDRRFPLTDEIEHVLEIVLKLNKIGKYTKPFIFLA